MCIYYKTSFVRTTITSEKALRQRSTWISSKWTSAMPAPQSFKHSFSRNYRRFHRSSPLSLFQEMCLIIFIRTHRHPWLCINCLRGLLLTCQAIYMKIFLFPNKESFFPKETVCQLLQYTGILAMSSWHHSHQSMSSLEKVTCLYIPCCCSFPPGLEQCLVDTKCLRTVWWLTRKPRFTYSKMWTHKSLTVSLTNMHFTFSEQHWLSINPCSTITVFSLKGNS